MAQRTARDPQSINLSRVTGEVSKHIVDTQSTANNDDNRLLFMVIAHEERDLIDIYGNVKRVD